ncbi:hypothetical protein ACFXTH_000378 [Malus domestica]
MPKVASTIANRIAQHRGSSVPLVPKFVPSRILGTKSDSPLERLATMKNDKVDFAAKVALRPISFAAETGSPVEKDKTTRVGNCEKSAKPVSRKVTEICAL